MHAIKFSLVEDLADWRLQLFQTRLRGNPSDSERRQLYFAKLFELRRDLWQKDLSWLRREKDHVHADQAVMLGAVG